MAHRAWVLPVPGSPKASTLTPRSPESPWAKWSTLPPPFTPLSQLSVIVLIELPSELLLLPLADKL